MWRTLLRPFLSTMPFAAEASTWRQTLGLDTNGTYVAKISACNRAGCGRAVSVGIPLVPKPQIIISEKHQCIVEGKEKDFYIVGMKSYGRAPTFLMTTGYEQVRSIVAFINGDFESAKRVELYLPETGVCSSGIGIEVKEDIKMKSKSCDVSCSI